LSIIMSLLIFGLSNYYRGLTTFEQSRRNISRVQPGKSFSNSLFIISYVIMIIFDFFSNYNPQIFVHWNEITAFQTITLIAAILLSFFLPGYALIGTLFKKSGLKILPRLLLAYLLSILLTGSIAYLTASLGVATSTIVVLLGIFHLLLLAIFVWMNREDCDLFTPVSFLAAARNSVMSIREKVTHNIYEILVFASLFSLVILTTYYLYNGTIIQDQWFHHGRSDLFTSGAFRDVSHTDNIYPPFQHAFLANFFALSGIPSVNAYVSINFLNIIPVFAFYYFFTNWLPHYRKAALLGCTLFMLSSGFGWIYVLNLAATYSQSSPYDGFYTMFTAIIKTLDILMPNTFIDVSNPTITTGLVIIVLPAGFVLLGLIKERNDNKLKYFLVLAAISLLGYLTQAEFALFGIIASVIPIIFGLQGKNYIFGAILAALLIYATVGLLGPGTYYMDRGLYFPYNIKGLTIDNKLPLFVPFILFTFFTWIIYRSNLQKWLHRVEIRVSNRLDSLIKGRVLLVLAIILISITCYIYALSFIVWGFSLPSFDAFLNTHSFTVVPWYLYPMRFGVNGILALSFVLSYLFKRFEREAFVLGVIAIIALLAGPYYDELRLGKYVMMALAGFASLMLYQILSVVKGGMLKPLFNGLLISLVVISSSLSIILYIGYTELGANFLRDHTNDPLYARAYTLFDSTTPLTYFPPDSEMNLLRFLRNNIDLKADSNVALPLKDMQIWHGFNSKIVGFVGIPLTKMLQSPLTLQEASLEGLYTLLNYTNTKWIVLAKQYLADKHADVLGFAVDNFKRSYEDVNYIALSVPRLSPPSYNSNVALVSSQSRGDINNTYYYSLSALALSKIKYQTFAVGDFSAFSKKNVVLTFDPVDVSAYLKFVKDGGNIILLNSGDDFSGGFSKLLCISDKGEYAAFGSIRSSANQYVDLSGLARQIDVSCAGSKIKSYYSNNTQDVTPFIVEKPYGRGKITFVNTSGYFRAISASSELFSSLAKIPSFVGLREEEVPKPVVQNSAPFPYFVGSLNMSGQILINSSSFVFPVKSGFYSNSIVLSSNNSAHRLLENESSKGNLDNLPIRNLTVYGAHNFLVNSNHLSYSPSTLPRYSYIPVDIPAGSNITLNLLGGSRGQFLVGENKIVQLTGGNKVVFNGIKSSSLSNASAIHIIMKYPEISVDGKVSFQRVRSNDPKDLTKPWGNTIILPLPAQVIGKTILKLDHLIYSSLIGETATYVPLGYTTYFNWIQVNTDPAKPPTITGKLLKIAWGDVLNSENNHKAIVTILILTSLSLYFCLPSRKLKRFMESRQDKRSQHSS
jgi:hypothetical protein